MINPLERVHGYPSQGTLLSRPRHLDTRPPGIYRFVDFASEDYLGLSRDSQIASAAALAALNWGTGASASDTLGGGTRLHSKLESTLADFLQAPQALLFSSHHLANHALLSLIGNPDVLVICDEHNQLALIEACRISGGRHLIVEHNNTAAIEQALSTRIERHAIVVTDAVFAAEGDLAPLRSLHSLTRQHNAFLLVDESHALGVVGAGGQGAVVSAQLQNESNIIRTVSLATALGSQGGAVAASEEIISALTESTGPLGSDAVLAPPAVGAGLAALQILTNRPGLALQVRTRAGEIALLVESSGLSTRRPDAAILGIRFTNARATEAAKDICAEYGLRVTALHSAALHGQRAVLRLTARANMTDTDLTTAGRALAELARNASRH